MGIRAANEKIFSTADRMLNTMLRTRYFLYGGTNLLSTLRNSFIFFSKDFYSIDYKSTAISPKRVALVELVIRTGTISPM